MNGANGGFTKEERGILVISSTCHYLSHMLILVFPSITMPLVASLGLPLEEVIKISFLMYLCYGLCAMPAGIIVDHWQARAMLLLGLLGMGAGLILAGTARSPRTMSVCFMLVGIGASIYHPAGLSLISNTIQQRGRALAINGVFGNLGICTAPFATGILTWAFSWRWAVVILGITALLAAAVLSPLRMNERLQRRETQNGSSSTERLKYFLILCCALVMGGLAYRGNLVLLPAYLELKTSFFHHLIESFSFMRLHDSKTLAATILTSMVLLAGIFGQLFGGRLADRHDLRYGYLLVHALSVPFLVLMAFTSNYFLAVCAAGYAFFNFSSQPLENSLIAAFAPGRWRSTSYAVKFVLNFGIGSSVVYLIGPVKKAFSLEVVYVFLGGIACFLVLSIVALVAASRKTADVRN
jgi:FSR family fosmidomycin resistance protein-like MFS transporter